MDGGLARGHGGSELAMLKLPVYRLPERLRSLAGIGLDQEADEETVPAGTDFGKTEDITGQSDPDQADCAQEAQVFLK